MGEGGVGGGYLVLFRAVLSCFPLCLDSHDTGNLSILQEYEAAARRRNITTQAGVHTLHQMFAFKAPWFALARGLGMLATHNLSPVKSLLMAQALGAEMDLRGVGDVLA